MRVPSYDIADLESKIGPRGRVLVNSENRALVQNWICAHGFPSAWTKGRRIATLGKMYNSPAYLATMKRLRDRGDLGDMSESEMDSAAASAEPLYQEKPAFREAEAVANAFIAANAVPANSPTCEVCATAPATLQSDGHVYCGQHAAIFRSGAPMDYASMTRSTHRAPIGNRDNGELLLTPATPRPAPTIAQRTAANAAADTEVERAMIAAADTEVERAIAIAAAIAPALPLTREGVEQAMPEYASAAQPQPMASEADSVKLAAASEALRAAQALAQTHEAMLAAIPAIMDRLQALESNAPVAAANAVPTHGSAGIPGTMLVSAADLFPGLPASLMVPQFVSRTEYTPEIDASYAFDKATTTAILLGFAHNRRVLISGKHGTGKSSHVEQVAARLNWPFYRLNLDGHLSRTDMIGRDSIVLQDGKQITEFKEGLLPWTMQQPMALCLDEYDAGRPDVLFVVQRLLEDGGKLAIAEQNRVVTPHAAFRIFGTANTVGLGDATGLYHGTNVLNAAQMDRWSMLAKLDYLPHDHEVEIVLGKVPSMDRETVSRMVHTATATRALFAANKITTVMSPRTVITWATNSVLLDGDLKTAFDLTFGNKCDEAEMNHIHICYNDSMHA